MAFADWNRLTSITRSFVMPGVVHQLKKEMPGFGHFLKKAKKRTTGGAYIEIPVTYRYNTQGGSYSGLDRLNTAQENTRTRARYEWKQVFQPLVIDNMELFKNGGKNASEETVVNLMEQEMEEAKESMKNLLAGMFYGDGTGTTIHGVANGDLLGLQALVDDGTDVASLGDITFATYSWWQSQVQSAVGSLTLAHMAAQYVAASSGNDKINMIITTETLKNAYEALHQPSVRYVSSGSAPSVDTINMDTLSFRGAKLMSDEYCTSGEMYFLNDKYIELYVGDHPDYSTDKSGFTVTDMRNPHDQDGKVGFILFYGQMINKRPSRHAKSIGLTA